MNRITRGVAGAAAAMVASLLLGACENMKALEHGSVIQTTTKADGSKVTVENRSDYANYANTKLELAKKNLFEIECPPEGCKFLRLAVANPNAGNDIAVPAPPPKVEHPFVGGMRETKELVLGAMPAFMVNAAANAVKSAFSTFGGSINTLAENIQAPAASVTTINTASGGSAIGGSATTAPVTTSTTTSTSTQNTNSGNTSIACTSGTASGGSATTQGAPSGGVACR